MEEIYQASGRLHLALTLPDEKARKKSGRVYLDDFCRRRGIPLFKYPNINDPDAVETIRANEIDWLFIIGWSQIARKPVLDAVKRGAIGMHPTLLPRGRGRAAIPWAIIKGLEETGVTMFQLDEGVDSGPILAQERLPLSADETATRLYRRVAQAHRNLIGRAWPRLIDDSLSPQPQDDAEATYWEGRRPQDGRIDEDMVVAQADRLIRATTRPYPGAFIDAAGKRFRIWQSQAASDPERTTRIQVDKTTGSLLFRLKDGWLESPDWEEEEQPPPEQP
ncbi:MAG TPA: formyltransferase family protein [Acidobacteriota bacterium]|nr:formyltransferase family protein [Acidobacteriota bacterium]